MTISDIDEKFLNYQWDSTKFGVKRQNDALEFFEKGANDETEYLKVVTKWCEERGFYCDSCQFGKRKLKICAWCTKNVNQDEHWNGLLLNQDHQLIELKLGFHHKCRKKLS